MGFRQPCATARQSHQTSTRPRDRATGSRWSGYLSTPDFVICPLPNSVKNGSYLSSNVGGPSQNGVMAILTDIEHQVDALRDLFGCDVPVDELTARMSALDAGGLMDAVTAASDLVRAAERISIVGAGIAAARSGRDAGQAGLAQSRGHRTPANLVQDISGVSHAEADVSEADAASESEGASEVDLTTSADTDHSPGEPTRSAQPWHAVLSTALLHDRISATQHDTIQRGLGHPIDDAEGTRAAWAAAAEQLIADAEHRTVEELRVQARAIRDQLDPDGAQRRFAERYERRSFRIWTDADGVERGRIDFEDDGAAWIRAIRDSALRPRRGGPRFVDSTEVEQALELTADARSNDQLSYDLLMDVLRAGALADAESVFGTRQAGVRIVQVLDAASGAVSARTEDYGFSLPVADAERRICETGSVTVTVDPDGNPLNVGREHRLFTPRQRIALAIRDGGCRWKGCDRPASYCEAHHIDEWAADKGRTDIDRGILLCRHHHMQLHHTGWRITRVGTENFRLHPPGNQQPVPLYPRSALTAAWAGIDPPPKRFRPVA